MLAYDRMPEPAELRALIWEGIRPDQPATKDQRALGFLALAILYLVEAKEVGHG